MLTPSLRQFWLFLLMIVMAYPTAAHAYNPPVDKVGALQVRIDGPSEVHDRATPISIDVVLENSGDEPISGSLKLGLIDQWQATPQHPMPFTVAAHKSVHQKYQVTIAADSYSAHYPIHAFATFQQDGQSVTVHPILILETKFSDQRRSMTVRLWKPLPILRNSALALWQTSTFRRIVEVFGQQPRVLPLGTIGVEPRSRADVSVGQPTLDGQTRSAIIMHPPWYEGQVGTVLVEFPLDLPAQGPIKLKFANAMNPGGQSDGVTFRVRVAPWSTAKPLLGQVVFQRHIDAYTWQDAEVDLSAFAGRQIRLQLEAHPGPQNNTGWDRCFWAEPTVVAGTLPAAPAFPPTTTDGSEEVGTTTCGQQTYRTRLWLGPRGLLDCVVGIEGEGKSTYLRGFEVTVLAGAAGRNGIAGAARGCRACGTRRRSHGATPVHQLERPVRPGRLDRCRVECIASSFSYRERSGRQTLVGCAHRRCGGGKLEPGGTASICWYRQCG